jgi:NADPH2:quinone reductase
MKAIGFYQSLPIEETESLLDVTLPKPQAKGRDLLVKVEAISVNPVDVKVRANGKEKMKDPKVIGYDVAGIVEEVGDEVTLFQPGDEVYYSGSIARAGGNSEFHLIDERIVAKKPKTLNFAEAAALPLTSVTAWEAMFERLNISTKKEDNSGKHILIIGAAGGVGSIAVQLAKHVGLTVIGTASREETKKWVLNHGADHVISHYKSFSEQLKNKGIPGVDYVFSLNATDKHWENMIEAIAPLGKIASIVDGKEGFNLGLLKNKSVTFSYEYMFTRSLYQTKDMIEQHYILKKMSQLIDEGKIRTTLSELITGINATNLKMAHRKVESGKTIGKIVLVKWS